MNVPGLDAVRRRLRERAHARAIAARLGELVPQLDERLRKQAIRDVAHRVAADLGAPKPSPLALAGALVRVVSALLQDLAACEAEIAETALAYQAAPNPEEQRRVLASFIRATEPSRLRARGDIQATARWFDLEAAQERGSARVADRVDRLEIALRSIARLAHDLSPAEAVTLASRGRFIEVTLRACAVGMHRAVRVVALQALGRVLAAAPAEERAALLGDETRALILAWARGIDAVRWSQIAAIEIVAVLAPAELAGLAIELLARREAKDGMILRRNVLRVIATARPPEAARLVRLAADDPSEHVRQELARSLATLSVFDDLADLVLSDGSPRVRGVALRCLAASAKTNEDARAEIRRVLMVLLKAPSPPLVSRCALAAVRDLSAGAGAPLPAETFVEAVTALATLRDADPQIVEEATATLRILESEARPPMKAARDAIQAALADLGEGERRRILLPAEAERRDVERALAVAARGDMAVALHPLGGPRWLLTRGEPRRLRLWRFLHELKTPMPDKRKGYVHTRARVFAGEIVAPPIGMAEVTPTRVPGERQLCPPVGGWGLFLPRVDDLLSVCGVTPRALSLVTSAGTITVKGPKTLESRMRARLAISLKYPHWAEVRQRSLAAVEPAQRRLYAELCNANGFEFAIGDTGGEIGDRPFDVPPILALRYLGVLPPAILPWIREIGSYVVSRTGNSPTNLAWLILFVFGFLLARSAWTMREIERMRAHPAHDRRLGHARQIRLRAPQGGHVPRHAVRRRRQDDRLRGHVHPRDARPALAGDLHLPPVRQGHDLGAEERP